MALSGTFETNKTSFDGLNDEFPRNIVCKWSATQSIENNTSTISWSLYAGDCTNPYQRSYVNKLSFYIDGEHVYYNPTWGDDDFKFGGGDFITSGTITINHTVDGSRVVPIYLECGFRDTIPNSSYSGTIELDKIPRAATITYAPNFNDEENPTIYYNNSAGNNVSLLQACVSLNGDNDDIPYRNIVTTSDYYTFKFSESERNILRNNTSSNNRQVYFYIKTVIGSDTFYSKVPVTLSIINAKPELHPYVFDSNPKSVEATGDETKLIRYISNATATTGAKALKGSYIQYQDITNSSKTKSGSKSTFDAITSNGFSFYAKDGRGNHNSTTYSPPMVNYLKLTCNIRTDIFMKEDNTFDLDIVVYGNYYNGSFGAKNNYLHPWYRYKEKNTAWGDYVPITEQSDIKITKNAYTAHKKITKLQVGKTYLVQGYCGDYFMDVESHSANIEMNPVFDWSRTDFKFNVTPIVPEDKFMTKQECGLNMNNSDIGKVNGIFFNDSSDDSSEGINFYRDGKTWDSLYAKFGTIYFHHGAPGGTPGQIPYLVSSGNSNAWFYRKWSDGIAECFGRFRVNEQVTSSWGGAYVGTVKSVAYPFTFTEKPYEVATLHSGWGGTLYQEGDNSTTTSGSYAPLRMTTASNMGTNFDLYVVGKWK